MNYELFARQLDWPTKWVEVYGRNAPLLIEIGFGGGHFLRDLAQQRPSANVLGIDISLPSIRRGVQKIKQACLTNARVGQSTALYLFWAVCPPLSVSEVYINFPDPWPKAGHQRRRLINDRFLTLLASRLKTDGKLEIATDHADYAAVITTCLERTPYFHSRLPTTFSTEAIHRTGTKYESVALANGRVCHYFKWLRNEQKPTAQFNIPEEFPMPHVVLHSPMSLPEIQAQFTPRSFSGDDVHIKNPMIFQAQDGKTLLLETYVMEEPLAQRVAVTIRQRPAGEYVIGLSEIGFPRPTAGIQLAIGHIARWLLGLHSETKLLHHNLAEKP